MCDVTTKVEEACAIAALTSGGKGVVVGACGCRRTCSSITSAAAAAGVWPARRISNAAWMRLWSAPAMRTATMAVSVALTSCR